MTDNDRQHHDFNPENIGKTAKSAWEVLTHKAIYDSLTAHMKTQTKRTLRAALIAALIAAVIITLGLIEHALLPINH